MNANRLTPKCSPPEHLTSQGSIPGVLLRNQTQVKRFDSPALCLKIREPTKPVSLWLPKQTLFLQPPQMASFCFSFTWLWVIKKKYPKMFSPWQVGAWSLKPGGLLVFHFDPYPLDCIKYAFLGDIIAPPAAPHIGADPSDTREIPRRETRAARTAEPCRCPSSRASRRARRKLRGYPLDIRRFGGLFGRSTRSTRSTSHLKNKNNSLK